MDNKGKLCELIYEKISDLREKGYTYFDLIEMEYFTKEEISRMRDICMDYYYKYFTDRGLALKDIQIDLEKKTKTNCYFKKPKNSKMFKAMYGAISKAGAEYINCRRPANAMSCGMGTATSQPEIYFDEELCAFTERLRPLYNILYGGPVKRHLERFGLKLPYKGSKDMMAHVDMSYCKEYRETAPIIKNADDPVSYAPYAADGSPMRIQGVLGLSDSDAGWYGYEKTHMRYEEIGDALLWPGKKKAPQTVPVEVLEKLGMKRVDIPTKLGRLIIWNCGIVHGNSACFDTTPRLVKYINFMADKKNTVSTSIIGLGNQPKGKNG